MKADAITAADWLRQASQQLADAGIATARLDSQVLLADALRQDRAWLLAHDDYEITQPILARLARQLTRRQQHEPLAYIRGHAEFYGHTFVIMPDVLVPRPESEAIIDLSKELYENTKIVQCADIGTGSGCLAISLALACPAWRVDMYDIDASALGVARRNAAALGAEVSAYSSDLLASLHASYQLIVANLPYVPIDYPINKAASHEPDLALFSGLDGLGHYRRFWQQASQLDIGPAYIICEALPSQHSVLKGLAASANYRLDASQDFALRFQRA